MSRSRSPVWRASIFGMLFIPVLGPVFAPAFAQGAGSETSSLLLSHKLSLRSRNGFLSNSGTLGGSTATSLGGLGAWFHYFMSPYFAVNAGYKFDFDYSNGRIPMSGLDVGARWYVQGQGTRVISSFDGSRSETRDQYSIYLGGEITHQSYFIGTDAAKALSVDATGSFKSMEFAVGVDLPFSRSFELNLEGCLTALTFSSSDDRFRIRGKVIYLGLNYLW